MEFDRRVEEVLKIAILTVEKCRNQYITPEHILYGLANQKIFTNIMKEMSGDSEELLVDLTSYFMDNIPKYPARNSKTDSNNDSDDDSNDDSNEDKYEIEKTEGFAKVMEIAIRSAEGSGSKKVSIHHLLWGIYHLEESHALYYFEKQIDDKEEFIYRLQVFIENEQENEENYDDEDYEEDDAPEWEAYATLLNEEINNRNPLIGREKEIDRALQVLGRKEKNNPIFVGEAGVGKTAMAYGLAARVASGNVPEYLKGANVFSLDLGAMVAGTQYRGEFEKRIKSVMESFLDEENPIVFIDEIHNLVGAGGLSGNNMDASNLLKPYLEDGSIRFIGATTYSEYKKFFAKNTALSRRFQKIDIKEPSIEETINIIEGIKPRYEKFHNVRYGKGVVEYAVELSGRFINDRFFPDKALDLIDEAGAYRKLHPIDGEENTTDALKECGNDATSTKTTKQTTKKKTVKKPTVDKTIIEKVLSLTENIPLQTAQTNEIDKLKNLYGAITSKIYGQDEAVRKIVDSICMSRAGLLDENKPIASFLFVGPTGVGKTEVAKVLSKELGIQLVRFDMSEYAEKHTVAKLIGSPAGYVGYEDGGLLTDAIRKTPHCVLLLDEIEKAHSDIYNVLLQVMDYASLTDSKGQKADFKNVIIIMTSNAGARRIGKLKIGFGETAYDDGTMMEEVKKVFSPEFRNRLSSIVSFKHVDSHMAKLITNKKLDELRAKLSAKKVTLDVTNECMDELIKKGITREYGGREVERIINSEIKPLLVNELLFGSLKKGGKITLDWKDNKFQLKKSSNKSESVRTRKKVNA